MFTALSSSQIVIIAIFTLSFYGLIIAFVYSRKYWLSTKSSPVAATIGHTGSILGPSLPLSPARSPLSERLDEPEESAEEEQLTDYLLSEDDLPFPEEQYRTLRDEAERVVEQIQQVVDHIIVRPANPEEVFTKIRTIVSEYSFFFDTEYYDAINRFVAVTVHRDCDLQLSEEDLQSLWYAAAA